ncbi:FixH family protein [Cloacibacterium sp.]|jgi:hypothetical protein|uniref:FixH family protein n=1 Tax=Cloacibacterium sp. TaxID=1913682 RepID=UPI0035B3B3F5
MKKFTWGHGIALALACFIGFILYLIFIFPIGKQTSDLVSDNYYQDELEYQKVIDAKKNADQLSQKPFFAQLPYGIRIAFPKETIDAGQQVHFELYSTNDKEKDKKQNVNLDNNNSFLVPKEMLSTGSYTLKVRWKKSDIDYQVDYELVWK